MDSEATRKIEIEFKEIQELYLFLEKLNAFFHQPMHYPTIEEVHRFWEDGAYDELRQLYYDVVWNWLPPDVQRVITVDDETPA